MPTDPQTPVPQWPTRLVRTRSGHTAEIRIVEPTDAHALLAYFRRVGGESPHLSFGAEGVGLTEAEERAHIIRMRSTENALCLVATVAGEMIGSLAFTGGTRAKTRHTGEFGVSIAEAFWGEGLGHGLVETLFAWAAAGGVIRKIDLRVNPDNARAIAMYERLGFAIEGRVTRTMLSDGQFQDSFLMGRLVDPSHP